MNIPFDAHCVSKCLILTRDILAKIILEMLRNVTLLAGTVIVPKCTKLTIITVLARENWPHIVIKWQRSRRCFNICDA